MGGKRQPFFHPTQVRHVRNGLHNKGYERTPHEAELLMELALHEIRKEVNVELVDLTTLMRMVASKCSEMASTETV